MQESHSGGRHPNKIHVLCCLHVKSFPVLPLIFSGLQADQPISVFGSLSVFGCEMDWACGFLKSLLKLPHFCLALGHRRRKWMLEMKMVPPELAHSCYDIFPSLSLPPSSFQPSSAVFSLGWVYGK